MSRKNAIYTTDADLEQLGQLIETARNQEQNAEISYISDLAEKLEFAETVASEQISPDVVTMRSRVKVKDLDNGETQEYAIVFPNEADYEDGKISILAPLATALLGSQRGETVEVRAPSRTRRLKIEDILYQPESAAARGSDIANSFV